MRELRFATRTPDGGLVVESPDGLDRYLLAVDEPLRAAVARTPAVTATATTAPPSAATTGDADAIGPREIQVRVRAGEAPQALADEHGVPLDRIMRFAGPVLAERTRITEEARRARARRTGTEDTEPRVVMFGEAVDERFGAYGVDVESIAWDSRRREDGEWIVVATWLGGQGSHDAEWLFHRGSRSVTPLDDAAADLLSDRPIRPITPPAPAVDLRLAASAAPALAPGVIAFPPFPDAHTGPIPRVEQVFDQEDVSEGPRTLPPFVPAAVPVPAMVDDLADYDEPPLPLAITDAEGRPAAAAPRNLGSARGESDDPATRAARAKIPSWDDILLGVRRKQD